MGSTISYVLLTRNKNLNPSSSTAQGKEGQALAETTTNGAEKIHENPAPTFSEILNQAIKDTDLSEINIKLTDLTSQIVKLKINEENPFVNSLKNIQTAYVSAQSTNNQFLLS